MNSATALKGINLLVDEGKKLETISYKHLG